MKTLVKMKFLEPRLQYDLMFALFGILIFALTISLLSLINSYQNTLDSGILNAMSSITYP